MGLVTLSAERRRKLAHFRRNTWLAIALCLVVRMADSALGLGLVEPAPSLAAQETAAALPPSP